MWFLKTKQLHAFSHMLCSRHTENSASSILQAAECSQLYFVSKQPGILEAYTQEMQIKMQIDI